jgi:hypothetical protein
MFAIRPIPHQHEVNLSSEEAGIYNASKSGLLQILRYLNETRCEEQIVADLY